jgi:hypothetical protein
VGWEEWDQKFLRNFGRKAFREEICMDGTIMLKYNLRNRVEMCAVDGFQWQDAMNKVITFGFSKNGYIF